MYAGKCDDVGRGCKMERGEVVRIKQGPKLLRFVTREKNTRKKKLQRTRRRWGVF